MNILLFIKFSSFTNFLFPSRKTKETDIVVKLNLDGTGKSDINTGIGFFDHMLTSFAKHSFTDLEVKVVGDLNVDGHHTVEDTGIVLGEAIKKALGDKAILVADYKFLIPWDCMREAEKQGADYAIFEAGYHIDIMERTMREAEQLRINPIFCLSVHPKEFTFYADLYAEMGVRYFFTHHFYTVLDSETHTPVKYNNAISFSMCKRPIQFCITNDDFDQVPDSIRSGADWITFGKAIHSLDRSTCRKWVKMIHSTRRT